jgi:hypothetical protein
MGLNTGRLAELYLESGLCAFLEQSGNLIAYTYSWLGYQTRCTCVYVTMQTTKARFVSRSTPFVISADAQKCLTDRLELAFLIYTRLKSNSI